MRKQCSSLAEPPDARVVVDYPGPVPHDAQPHSEETRHRGALLRGVVAGRVPLKFAYVGSAAYTHDTYARTGNYSDMMDSAAHESAAVHTSRLLPPGSPAVVEIGPGNGDHSAALLAGLIGPGGGIRRYLGLDISATLLRMSSEKLRHRFSDDLDVRARVWDVEVGPSPVIERWRPSSGCVLVCLVGHTLGNFEDPVSALGNLSRSLRPGDVLLVSVLLRPGASASPVSQAAYDSAEFRRAVLAPMVAAGLNECETEFTVTYRDDAFVGDATLRHDWCLEKVIIPRGHRFQCFFSRRFDPAEIIHMIEQAGFVVSVEAIDPCGDHITVVASRTEGRS